MSRNMRLSRLNPVYLAYRHAGGFLLLLALGAASGLVWQALIAPRAYESEWRRAFAVVPPEAAFDPAAKARAWTDIASDRDSAILMAANLRAAVKRAAPPEGEEGDWSPERLRDRLLEFRSPRTYSSVPALGRLRPRVGPVIEVARHDLAANLDFQALARIVADLEPDPEIADWDISSHAESLGEADAAGLPVADPGPNDAYFRILYRLHALLNAGAVANSPAEAWLTAVEEVAARIVREFAFQGGGGFGEAAKRELLLEIRSLPVLAANGLYRVAGALYGGGPAADADFWQNRWSRETRFHFDHDGGARGALTIAMLTRLRPFLFPADAPGTRIAPLAARTAFAFIEAREENRGGPPPDDPAPPPPPPPPPPSPAPAADEREEREDDEAARVAAEARGVLLAGLEAEVLRGRIRRDEEYRGLDAARIAADHAAVEAMAARDRADRLKERLDEAEFTLSRAEPPPPEPEYLLLLDEREALLRHLAMLTQTCTDEHPFVIRARRELTALEGRMALFRPPAADPAGEGAQIRLRALREEWTAAESNAVNLAERLRRRRAEADRLSAELSDAEKALAAGEHALNAERLKPAPAATSGDPERAMGRNMERIAERLAEIADERKAPPPVEQPQRNGEAGTASARVRFSPLPAVIPMARLAPSMLPVYAGLALGLCLGLLWVFLREALTFRLTDSSMARRLVDLPLLAALPAYDGKSFAEAAGKAEGGKTAIHGGRPVFIPEAIERREPALLGKRRAVRLRGRRRRVLAWVLAALVAGCGVGLHQAVFRSWLDPVVPTFAPEILAAEAPEAPLHPGEERP